VLLELLVLPEGRPARAATTSWWVIASRGAPAGRTMTTSLMLGNPSNWLSLVHGDVMG